MKKQCIDKAKLIVYMDNIILLYAEYAEALDFLMMLVYNNSRIFKIRRVLSVRSEGARYGVRH